MDDRTTTFGWPLGSISASTQAHDPLTCPCCTAADESAQSDREEQAVFGAAFGSWHAYYIKIGLEPLDAARRARVMGREAVDAYWFARQESDDA